MALTIGHRRVLPLILAAALAAFSLFWALAVVKRALGEEARHVRKPPPSPEVIAGLPSDGGPSYNRLVFEKSPYLLQHAANPVDWRPWGEEAFAEARQQDKPVFLSVGYSTCHWCHVMEHESFEDDEVAALMNEHFIAIKVDREERPDIDNVYMTVTQAMTGSGGWPMTVVMTPDKKPFFAGTYFPKEGRQGRPGMMQLVPHLSDAWKKQRDKVNELADRITTNLHQLTSGSPGEALDASVLDKAYQMLAGQFDTEQGGFGRAPKFPVPHNLSFLLRYWKRSGEPKALAMVEKTLEAMRLGGVYDQIGLGTHRYATDRVWLLPHFEKMLYDQALLAIAHVEAYQATGKEIYARTAREIFTYVLRDMTSPQGAFYSAEDADSEGEEGKFYVWKPQEVLEILGDEDGRLYNQIFNIVEGGNFTEQATQRKTGDSIPHLRKPIEQIAADLKTDATSLRQRVATWHRKLFEVREKRIHPYKDDKILTDWNGLMIAALARAGQALDEPAYTEAARRAADFVLSKLRRSDGRLLKRYRQSEAGLPAHLEDYAFMVWGLLDLYEATFELSYLTEAIALNALMLEHFWDGKDGGLFHTADDGEPLLVRSKKIYDGAIPSGNSVAALNLLRVGRITADAQLEQKAEALMKAFSGQVVQNAAAYCQLMVAVDFAVGPSFEIVIAAEKQSVDTTQMLRGLRRKFLPNKVVLLRPEGDEAESLAKIAPYTEAQTSRNGAATAYVCRNFACKMPTTDVQTMLASLEER